MAHRMASRIYSLEPVIPSFAVDIPKVLALAVVTFLVLSVLMKYLGTVPALSERLEPDGSPLEAPFAFIVVFLLCAWMPFFSFLPRHRHE